MVKFRVETIAPERNDNISSLFLDLSKQSHEIKYLWAHQRDVLNEYNEKHESVSDVAIELPTGTGKTLVGLLISEYRRRNFSDKVVYLTATKQLAYQVQRQANKLGVKASVFVGSQKDYDSREFFQYQSGKSIAITSYSSVFNVNPRLNDADILIFDDAHSAESYISSMWSLTISREEYSAIYEQFLALFKEHLPDSYFIDYEFPSPSDVELVPGVYFRNNQRKIHEILTSLPERSGKNYYAWRTLKDNLSACNLYFTKDSFLIRPIIPPTMTHSPFARAKQRIYMSATLGVGGELERIIGVKNIARIPVPAEWEKQSNGRRLFLAPELALDEGSAFEFTTELLKIARRGIYICPSIERGDEVASSLAQKGIDVLGAESIETSTNSFTQKDNIALVLSRYDGIDFPDDECRLLVISGKPSALNIQERFFIHRIAASSILRVRTITRFSQGIGRCTRSNQDYSIVIILDQDLSDYLMSTENTKLLHPEIQAELEFGLENSIVSEDGSVPDFIGLSCEFLDKTAEWGNAESAIIKRRQMKTKTHDVFFAELEQSVSHEIDYTYALWHKRWEQARDHAKKAFESLSHCEFRGYRGLWMYLAGDAELALNTDESKTRAAPYFEQASYDCPSLSWLLALKQNICGEKVKFEDASANIMVDNIFDFITRLGTTGAKFSRELAKIEEYVGEAEHTKFHQGIESLGNALGFSTIRKTERGCPDCIWYLEGTIYISFEAKTEQKDEGEIGKKHVLEAAGHIDWIKANLKHSNDDIIIPLIISPRDSIEKDAEIYGRNLLHLKPHTIKKLFVEMVKSISQMRNDISGLEPIKAKTILSQQLQQNEKTLEDILTFFRKNSISS